MNRKRWISGLICIILIAAAAAGGWHLVRHLWTRLGAETVDPTAPGHLAVQIDVAMHPQDPDFARSYTTEQHLTDMLRLLRTMSFGQEPEQTPDLEDGQNYYSIQITYANGATSTYYLLGHRYIRLRSGEWRQTEQTLTMAFSEYLRDHPEDGDCPLLTETVPTQPSEPVPTESVPQPTE